VLANVRTCTEPMTDVQCRAEATLTFQKHSPIVLRLHYLFRAPDRAKVVVCSRFAPRGCIDFFEHKTGMAYTVAGNEVAYYNPFLRRLHRTDLSAVDAPPAVSRVYGTGNVPELAPWLKGLFDLTSGRVRQPTYVGQETLNGAQCDVVDIFPADPPAHLFGHALAKVRKWIDTSRRVPLQSIFYGPDDQQIAMTKYEMLAEVTPGLWVALLTRTEFTAGKVELAREMTVKQGDGPDRKEIVRADLPIPPRIVLRRYSWVADRALLPQSIEVRDEQSNVLMHIRFFDYIMNSGVPDSTFVVPPLREIPVVGDQ